MSLCVLPHPGAVCRIRGPEKSGLVRWTAGVSYAWSWVKAVGRIVNGVQVWGWSKVACQRKAEAEVDRFYAEAGS